MIKVAMLTMPNAKRLVNLPGAKMHIAKFTTKCRMPQGPNAKSTKSAKSQKCHAKSTMPKASHAKSAKCQKRQMPKKPSAKSQN